MSTTITNAFIQHFGADVKQAYQNKGSKFKNTVTARPFSPGEKTRFQRFGKGEAVQKARHGEIAPMNLPNDFVDCTVGDWYAGEWIDEFDENKLNVDARSQYVDAQTFALGRRSDLLIRDSFLLATGSGGSRKYLGQAAQPIDLSLILKIEEDFNTGDIPDDGQRYWWVGPKTWSGLMTIPQFINADYIGYDQLPYKVGMSAKRFNTLFISQHSKLASDGNGDERTMLWHKTGVGHATVGDGLNPDWDWSGPKRAWFVSHGFTQGAVVIDNVGTLEVVTDVT